MYKNDNEIPLSFGVEKGVQYEHYNINIIDNLFIIWHWYTYILSD